MGVGNEGVCLGMEWLFLAVIRSTLTVYVLTSIIHNLCTSQSVILIGNKVSPDVAT